MCRRCRRCRESYCVRCTECSSDFVSVAVWWQFGYCLLPFADRTLLCLLRHARRRCSLPLPLLEGAVTPVTAARGINFESVALHDVLQRRLLHCVSTHVLKSRKSR